jgi:DNA-binding HxlR family transcriptional regulator
MATLADHPRFEHGQAFMETISERWNYLIMREVFFGVGRFGELRRALNIAPNILTARLNSLTELGMLTKRQYRADKPWFEYTLSDPARDLVVPALVAITRWAETYQGKAGAPAGVLRHTICGEVTRPYLACSACGQPVTGATLTPVASSSCK